MKSKRPPKSASVLSVKQLRDLLAGLRASDYCREYDLADSFIPWSLQACGAASCWGFDGAPMTRLHERPVREELGFPGVTTHSFRKSVATLIDDRGLSARVGADQLGHARPSTTQDV
jgi:hypothetical protein